jgi:osmoprotectant transport system permease protein
VADLARELAELPTLLSAHASLTALAAGIAVAGGVPLGVLVARRPRISGAVLGVAGVLQTIPGLALLALMVALLGAFGFWPALLALVLYALLPILRNSVTGILGVDAAVLEAADGMGMTPRQRLLRVELPLGLPVILAGVRTAVVWTVGMATLATPVGQPSLGSFIFGGLQTRNSQSVLIGCVAAALLAILLDAVLGAVQRAIAARRRPELVLSLAALGVVLSGSVLAPVFVSEPARDVVALTPEAAAPRALAANERAAEGSRREPAPAPDFSDRPVVVGAKTFTEQYVLARLLAARLSRAGLAVERREGLGSTVAFDALANGDIDVYVEYTGTIWSTYMQRGAPESSWRTLALVGAWLAEGRGVRLLGALGFENAYCLAMRRQRAAELGIDSLADLAGVGPRGARLSLGSDYEFLKRAEWAGLAEAYGFAPGRTATYDPSFMYTAVARGEVDLISAFSSDGRIAELDLVVLADPKRALPPYDAVVLLSPRVAGAAAVVRALEPLLGAIPVDRMRYANQMVDRDQDKRSAEEAADWLSARVDGARQ